MRDVQPARAVETDGWRERAVERSLRTARERAVSRSERFIQVATELLYETGSLDFTVQDLVERSQMSLRSFYQHFASKDELLLAVFEEAIRSYVGTLRVAIEAEPDPVAKLRIYVTSFYGAGESANRRASAALSRYLLMLTSDDPTELARVLAPQVALLAEIVDLGVAAGRLRRDISPSVLTILVTQTLMSAVEMNLLGTQLTGEPIRAEDVVAFCEAAVVAADPGGATTPMAGPGRRRALSPRR
ncbi:MAG TPA: TetR/AcrR family transcriptional regulator [Acidimicrobiales bacterium]|nr:TetR/AcrR family transcriptional regulator [Acidimicrobiales bacterium]